MANSSRTSKTAKRRAKIKNLKSAPRKLSATEKKRAKGGYTPPITEKPIIENAFHATRLPTITDGTANTIITSSTTKTP